MTSEDPVQTAALEATCPLCHTANPTVTADELAAGALWRCTRCGQTWSAQRLETAAAYVRFDAAYKPSTDHTAR